MTETVTPPEPSARTALLLLDVHRDVLGQLPPDKERSVRSAMTRALAAAREAGAPVIYVTPHYRPGYPELAPFAAYVRERGLFAEDDPAESLPEEFARRRDEPIVAKFVYSPFYCTDLELLLRRTGVGKVVLGGVSTSGVVLSALREAFDRDFQVVVLADACADFDQELHDILVKKLFPAQAVVITSTELTQYL